MPSPSSSRRGVVVLLVLLFAITYLDRVCISVAGPRMQHDLGIDAVGWGWVTGENRSCRGTRAQPPVAG
jgi:hypothetical protein